MTYHNHKDGEPDREFTISQLRKEFGLTSRALRFYETAGLLSPLRRGQHRIYSRRDRARLKLVLLGKRMRLPLVEIKQLLDLYDPADGGVTQRHAALVKCREQIDVLQQEIRDRSEGIEELTQVCRMIEQEDGGRGVSQVQRCPGNANNPPSPASGCFLVV
ncbi:MAG: MerR family DNA-binding transcriptional regulator, partial [Pseudomonadota bacterium]